MSDGLTRKEFIRLGAAATVALGLAACSGDDDAVEGGGDSGGDCTGDAVAQIASNHGHALTVPQADIDAGEALMLELSGPHTHPLTLQAADVAALAAGETVMKTSGSGGADGHNHQVTLSC